MYRARVLEVLVASPSDTMRQREAIRRAVVDWNTTNSRFTATVILPVMWETHSYPSLMQPAQSVINEQIVDDADILIATFWTRLGSPTAGAESGTIEEIVRFREAGKPILVYFCNSPVAPLDTDTTQTDRVREYRERLKSEGLFSEYVTEDELQRKVRDDLSKYCHDDWGERRTQGVVEEPADSNSGTIGVKVASELAGLRNAFNGWVSRWEAELTGLLEDYNLDNRYALARQVHEVALETLRMAATIDPDSSLLKELSAIVNKAANVNQIRVYLDGGQSFNALSDGCRDLVEQSRSLAGREWLPVNDKQDVQP